jgi:hypothetical protein
MEPEIYAELELWSADIAPNEMSERLGLDPTKTWRRGDVLREGQKPQADHHWVLTMAPRRSWSFDEPLEELLASITQHAVELRELVRRDGVTAQVCLVGYLFDSSPGVTLSSDTLATLADLGVGVNMDLYVMEEGVSLIERQEERPPSK